MSFTVDKQTLDDLNILGKYKGNSIFNLFNHTHTRGGGQLLESMFQHPLCNAEDIEVRSSLFQYFQKKKIEFPVKKELLDNVEYYLSAVGSSNLIGSALMMSQRKILQYIGSDKRYDIIHSGVISLIEFLNLLKDFFNQFEAVANAPAYQKKIEKVRQIFSSKVFKKVLTGRGVTHLSMLKIIEYDHLLRYSCQNELKWIMELLYETDVYIAVSDVARQRGFVYASAIPMLERENKINMVNVFHPQLPDAVPNSVNIDYNRNLIFLTGANMAGKSTFMKSFGVAVYLAHMGFPVAAENMVFSVQDGMYTSINVGDDLNMGYSHFYAEVLRVKQVAEEVSLSKNLVIIFDELFKGTNVKDAYDATVAVTEAFAENRNCTFIVSTHIVEAGEDLQKNCLNMEFVYFPTIIKEFIPTYTYKLQRGISSDRHGMMIINNERIVEIIKGKEAANEAIASSKRYFGQSPAQYQLE